MGGSNSCENNVIIYISPIGGMMEGGEGVKNVNCHPQSTFAFPGWGIGFVTFGTTFEKHVRSSYNFFQTGFLVKTP